MFLVALSAWSSVEETHFYSLLSGGSEIGDLEYLLSVKNAKDDTFIFRTNRSPKKIREICGIHS